MKHDVINLLFPLLLALCGCIYIYIYITQRPLSSCPFVCQELPSPLSRSYALGVKRFHLCFAFMPATFFGFPQWLPHALPFLCHSSTPATFFNFPQWLPHALPFLYTCHILCLSSMPATCSAIPLHLPHPLPFLYTCHIRCLWLAKIKLNLFQARIFFRPARINI